MLEIIMFDSKIGQPEDKGILLRDIIESDGSGYIKNREEWKEKEEKSQCLDANYFKGVDNHGQRTMILQKARGNNAGGLKAVDGKTPCMGANSWQDNNHLVSEIGYRKLTPIECERLQTVPDRFTAHVSNTQRYRMLGNGWNVDTVAHVLKHSGLRI